MKNRTDQLLLAALAILVICYFVFVRNNDTTVQPVSSVPMRDTSPQVLHANWNDAAFPLFFDAAFRKGTTVTQGKETLAFTTSVLGNLLVESGKVICCDEVNAFNAKPFTQAFPLGKYPVELALIETGEYSTVALARVVFKSDTVARWEYALLPGQNPKPISDEDIYCYPVDAATALFIDSAGNEKLSSLPQDEWMSIFMREGHAEYEPGFMHDFYSHNMAVFTTGQGDGCYCTFIGYNRKGEVCYLLTDFALFEWWK